MLARNPKTHPLHAGTLPSTPSRCVGCSQGADGCLFSGCEWRRPPCFPCRYHIYFGTSIFLPDRSAPPSASLQLQRRHRESTRPQRILSGNKPPPALSPDNPNYPCPPSSTPLGSIRHLRDSRVPAVFFKGLSIRVT
jgi:hypothetical protein